MNEHPAIFILPTVVITVVLLTLAFCIFVLPVINGRFKQKQEEATYYMRAAQRLRRNINLIVSQESKKEKPDKMVIMNAIFESEASTSRLVFVPYIWALPQFDKINTLVEEPLIKKQQLGDETYYVYDHENSTRIAELYLQYMQSDAEKR